MAMNAGQTLQSESARQTAENPRKGANVFSVLSFWWATELLVTGNKRPLEHDDLFPLQDEHKTQLLTEKLQRTWNEETTRRTAQKSKRGYQLFRAVMRMFPWTDYLFVLSTSLLASLGNVLQPLFLSFLLPELTKSSLKEFSVAYLYAGGICLSSLMKAVLHSQFEFNATLMGEQMRWATAGVIYKKVLCLSQADAITKVTSGYIINLIASDLLYFTNTVYCISALLQTLFELSTVSFLMFYLFGWKPLSGVVFLVMLSLYYGAMGKVCGKLRSNISKVADRRINIMNSIISGIRTVKMYAWEQPFMERVQRIRRQESKLIRWKAAISATFSSLLYSSQPIAACISLATLAATGTELTSYNTFMILSLISTLRATVSWNMSQSVAMLADFAAAVARVQNLLNIDDHNSHKYGKNILAKQENNTSRNSELSAIHETGDFNDLCRENDQRVFLDEGPDILVRNITCSWTGDQNKPTLKSVWLSVHKGDLLFITGPVGCGKTSLLQAVLHEIPLFKGEIFSQGKIAWVGQRPWVFSGTIRDNILFGEPLESDRYHMVLQACDLNQDLQRFPAGDMTRVGERGIVLSGGQQARVALARGVYSNADVYLLDDPLSAVDSKVGHHIFNACVSSLLGGKTRLMVTHNLQILKDTSDVIAVMKEGAIVAQGTYETLLKSGFDLDVTEKSNEKKEARTMVENSCTHEETDAERLENEGFGLETAEEDRAIGSVSWKVYWQYIRAGLNTVLAMALVMVFLVVQGSLILPDWWLLHMTDESRDREGQTDDFSIYGGLVGGALLLSIMRAGLYYNALINSCFHLHKAMLSAVLKAPVFFFDTNPVGRILNRFARDIGIMDGLLPDVSLDAVQLVLFCVGAVSFPSILNPWIIFPAVPLVVVFILIGRYSLKTSRDLKRLDGVNQSPVLSHVSDTLEGLVTIRAYKKEDAFLEEFYGYQDKHSQVWFAIRSTIRWLAFRLDMLCVIFVTFVVFLAIATQAGPGITVLSLVYTLQLTVDTSQYGVFQCSEAENYMTSVERVIAYTRIEQEPGYQNHFHPPENWPERGQIRVNKLGLVYYQNGPKILQDVSFHIDPNEKIGIVGRTGAGKSSLVSALFRMPEPSGDVIIDDVKISDINIQCSRQAMSVITQNPVLFAGSLRMNLDPFEEHGDRELWDALEHANLKAKVTTLPRQLREEVKECGANFSVGERQLLCLARALLKKNKIIVMDEATANVDHKTDQLIQETIRTNFKHCTVITIAHRLNTVRHHDKVLVLDNGRVVEYDTPEKLLQNERGHFSRIYHSYVNQ